METPYELLRKYCRNETSPEENREVEEWLVEEDNYSLFLDLQKEWVLVADHSLAMPDKESVWKKIKTRIARDQNKSNRPRLFKMIAAASVALIIISGSAFLYFRSLSDERNVTAQHTTIVTKNDEKKEVILADGSKVWLNSNSTLSYNDKYNIDNRNVTVQGECFFDIKPSDTKFIVNSGKIRIEVLGTAFNLKSFVNQDVEISLKRGKIAVFQSGGNKQLFVMEPLQHARIYKSDLSYVLTSENIYLSDIWKEESLQIYNEPLRNILNKLEIWYEVDISCTGLNLDKHYTFLLEGESLEEFLEIFSALTPIRYTIHGKKVHIEAIDAL